MSSEFQVEGTNSTAPFTLKIHRGDGMALVAMNWRSGAPPRDFVGFAVEYKEPGGDRFFSLRNRLSFPAAGGRVDAGQLSTRQSPIQKFRWVHFPRNADLTGDFVYRITPVFMNAASELSFGDAQLAALQLSRETFPGQLNVTFTRGFVSSQAFVDRYESAGPISTLIPGLARGGLGFVPTHPLADDALTWMGFEARSAILELLDQAISDSSAQVCVVAYDLNEPGVVSRLERLGSRLKIIIDDSKDHGDAVSAETQAASRLLASAGIDHVKRQHMLSLQHNKTIVVNGDRVKAVVCGSTNFSWRGFYVQSNSALLMRGASVVAPFLDAFQAYWSKTPKKFGSTSAANWNDLKLAGIDASVSFSPHGTSNALLSSIADDVGNNTTSSLFFSLAFLYQTPGPVLDAIAKVSPNEERFVYGLSDRKVGGLDLTRSDGNVAPVYPSELAKNLPEPFSREPSGGSGVRMHHKFVVIDFDKPTARVYLGSNNFSAVSDTKNGENLLLIRDRRVAVSYVVEALRIFDHYRFRVAQKEANSAGKALVLMRPPRSSEQKCWWDDYYTNPRKIRDRELFA